MAKPQTRGETLLRAAADAFEQGIDPFSTPWLVEHEVTAQECFDLGQSLSTIIKAYLASDAETRAELLLISAFSDDEYAERIREFLHVRHVRKRMAQEELRL